MSVYGRLHRSPPQLSSCVSCLCGLAKWKEAYIDQVKYVFSFSCELQSYSLLLYVQVPVSSAQQ